MKHAKRHGQSANRDIPTFVRGLTGLAMAAAFVLELSAMASDDFQTETDVKSPWSGNAEVNFNATSGNTDIESIGASAEVDFKTSDFNTRFRGGFLRNDTDNVERARTIFGQLRTGKNITQNLDWFVQGTYYQNKFAGLDYEWTLGTGPGFYLFTNDTHNLRAEGMVGYLWESYTNLNTSDKFTIGRVGLAYTLKLTDFVDLLEDVAWIDNFKRTSDWRLENTTSLATRLASFLNLKFSYNLMRRVEPVAGHKSNDHATMAALVFKF